jgi:hypothetical protein
MYYKKRNQPMDMDIPRREKSNTFKMPKREKNACYG